MSETRDNFSADSERKEQAERAESVARQALREGDVEKAIRLLDKANRLFPSFSAKDLLEKLKNPQHHQRRHSPDPAAESDAEATSSSDTSHSQQHKQPQQPSDSSHTSTHKPAPSSASSASPKSTHPHQRSDTGSAAHAHNTSSSNSQHHNVDKSYTPEDLEEVNKKIKIKDYYQILDLTKSATEADIKKAYRRLALKFHPDKNHAPGSADVFKAVSASYACLSDEKKRKDYDTFGHDATVRGEQTGAGPGGMHFQTDDLRPEEIFEMFFNGRRFPSGSPFAQQFHYQRGRAPAGPRSPFMSLIQFLPLLVLFLFSFLNAPGGDDQIFSLKSTHAFQIKRTTAAGVDYFVDRSFSRYLRDSRAIFQIESQVDQSFGRQLQEECNQDRTRLKRLKASAKKLTGKHREDVLRELDEFQLTACHRFEQWGGVVRAA